MSRSVKISLAIIAIAGGFLLGAITATDDRATPRKLTAAERTELLVRPDTRKLTDGSRATLVEFLDFECEACALLYPTIDELVDEYGDRVTFVVRYLPLHTSSLNAARAAEAAAVQGRFTDMYDVLFARQAEWGHQDDPEEDRFFEYAEELGLDMDRFRATYDDPATAERIEQSEQDAQELGVSGTPTLFLDGERLEPKSIDDLTSAIDAAARS